MRHVYRQRVRGNRATRQSLERRGPWSKFTWIFGDYIMVWNGWMDGWMEILLSLIDDCTRLLWLFLTKDWEATIEKATLERWLARTKQKKGLKLLIIQIDKCKEFEALEPWALEKVLRSNSASPAHLSRTTWPRDWTSSCHEQGSLYRYIGYWTRRIR
jgi:hypothetical protein